MTHSNFSRNKYCQLQLKVYCHRPVKQEASMISVQSNERFLANVIRIILNSAFLKNFRHSRDDFQIDSFYQFSASWIAVTRRSGLQVSYYLIIERFNLSVTKKSASNALLNPSMIMRTVARTVNHKFVMLDV